MDQLKKRYHDVEDSLNYATYGKIKSALKQLNPKQIMNFLLSEEAYTMFKPRVKKFVRRKIIRKDIWEQLSADLVDVQALASKNAGKNWILLLTDNFSGYTVLEPLSTKGKSDVREGLQRAFQQLPCSTLDIKRIHTDQGESRHLRVCV